MIRKYIKITLKSGNQTKMKKKLDTFFISLLKIISIYIIHIYIIVIASKLKKKRQIMESMFCRYSGKILSPFQKVTHIYTHIYIYEDRQI